jgi:protein involved in polysaccharide export with SLBB domain
MTVYDLIFLAGNLERNAYKCRVELARTDYAGCITTQIIDVTDERMRRIELEEDDRVFVREIPDWFLHRLVSIEGEVRFPGRYSLLSGEETLYHLLKRAGGFTERAFPEGLILQRRTIGTDLVRQNIPDIILNSQPLVEDSLGNVHKLETGSFDPQKMNRIIVDVEKIMTSEGREGDIRLQRDDYIYVPEIPSGVSVIGAVASNGTIKYESNRSVEYYIKKAGSFTSQAKKSDTKLIKASGQVFAKNGTMHKKVDIGDVIFVPTEIKKQRDWLKSASTVATILGGVLTSVLIIDRL